MWIQHLRTNQLEVLGLDKGGIEEVRLEDYIVSGLVDFNDVAYDDHADLLYDLASQTVKHFLGYLSEEDTRKVLRLHQRDIARFIHAQMQGHYWEDEVDYEVKISKGFTELKSSAYTASEKDTVLDFHISPSDMALPEVLVKKESAVRWCRHASDYARTYDGKPWQYLLIPHDAVSDNMTLAWFAGQFGD